MLSCPQTAPTRLPRIIRAAMYSRIMSNAEGQMVLVGENATGYQLTLTTGKDNNSVTRFYLRRYGNAVALPHE